MKNLFVINGSASEGSSNLRLIEYVADICKSGFEVTIYDKLKSLPHFDLQLSTENTPDAVVALRDKIDRADGVMICTPEYVFSIPSGLKNAIEWCVSTTVFSDKPLAIITASAHGEKGHEELQLIMGTLMAKFNAETTMLIQGIKGKITQQGTIEDQQLKEKLIKLVHAFGRLMGKA